MAVFRDAVVVGNSVIADPHSTKILCLLRGEIFKKVGVGQVSVVGSPSICCCTCSFTSVATSAAMSASLLLHCDKFFEPIVEDITELSAVRGDDERGNRGSAFCPHIC